MSQNGPSGVANGAFLGGVAGGILGGEGCRAPSYRFQFRLFRVAVLRLRAMQRNLGERGDWGAAVQVIARLILGFLQSTTS